MKLAKYHPLDNSGQTLVVLLIFMLIIITVTTAAATITVINIRTNNSYASGQQAFYYAESGAENALEQLLRNPDYSGETIAFQNGAATISVSGTTVKNITSQGVSNNSRRTITITATYEDGTLQVNSWSETP